MTDPLPYVPTLPKDAVALLTADWHLSLRPPVARSAEPDWLEAQGRPLKQLNRLANHALPWPVPLLMAGDLFDRYNPPPELVNWTIQTMPTVYAVPGQHDLQHHSYRDIRKSAYWTLKEAGKVIHLEPGQPVEILGKVPLRVHGFPWGFKPAPPEKASGLALEVAVVHRYLWVDGKGHPGAAPNRHLNTLRKRLRGYDAAVFGDNHVPFSARVGTCRAFNCGGLQRRRSDEVDHRPSVGVLTADGKIKRHYLDVSKDLFLDEPDLEKTKEYLLNAHGFIQELSALNDAVLDFREAIRHALDREQVPEGVRKWVLTSMKEDEK